MPSGSSGKWKTFFASRWFLGGLFVLTVFAAVAYIRAYYQQYQIQMEIKQLQEEARALEAKKVETLEALTYLKSLDFIKEKARKELNMAEPGEQVAVISNTAEIAGSGQDGKNMIKQTEVVNPVKWWRYFLNQSN